MDSQGSPPALSLVRGTTRPRPIEWTWFCGHCAARVPNGAVPSPASRVCTWCDLGLLLETPEDAAPSERDAFLVIDASLLVQAVSREGQTLLGVSEEAVVNRPVVELLLPADAEANGSSRFPAALALAAASGELGTAFVRPWNIFGVRLRARIAPCGPPRAALVVLEDPSSRRLRAVR